jgi:hypothetical protein
VSEREERRILFLLSEDESRSTYLDLRDEETLKGVRERLREARWGAWGSKHVKSGHTRQLLHCTVGPFEG